MFNLCVEGEPMFYANGVLTHNCAAHMGRALMDAHPAIVAAKEKVQGPQDRYAQMRRDPDYSGDWMSA